MENLYITKVVKTGTSLGIIIPKNVLVGINLQRGDRVLLSNFAPGQFTASHLTDGEIRKLKGDRIEA